MNTAEKKIAAPIKIRASRADIDRIREMARQERRSLSSFFLICALEKAERQGLKSTSN